MDKIISFILASKNDSYMGQPLKRLERSVNILANNASKCGRLEHIEILICDWGSRQKISEAGKFNENASKVIKYLYIPDEQARILNKDSAFAEVIALNIAAKKSRGFLIARIDQDTIVGEKFFNGILNKIFHSKDGFSFSCRRRIPYFIAKRYLPEKNLEILIKTCGNKMVKEEYGPRFFNSPVGIMIIPKSIWQESTGYDEKLLYWGWMEVDFAIRIEQKYKITDISQETEACFYHQEHFAENKPRHSLRKNNPQKIENLKFKSNSECWGDPGINVETEKVSKAKINKGIEKIQIVKNIPFTVVGIVFIILNHYFKKIAYKMRRK